MTIYKWFLTQKVLSPNFDLAMVMLTLVCVRHGEAEHNLATPTAISAPRWTEYMCTELKTGSVSGGLKMEAWTRPSHPGVGSKQPRSVNC